MKVKSVEDYLRETPAAPLSPALKAGLGGAGAVTALMLVAVLVIGSRRPKAPITSLPQEPDRIIAKATEPPKSATSSSAAERKKSDLSDSTPDKAKKSKNRKSADAKEKESKETPPEEPTVDAVSGWNVAVDSPAQPFEISAGQDLTIPIPMTMEGGIKVLYPTTPSPFLVVGNNSVDAESREVWDLRTKKRTGLLRGALRALPPFAISPDGALGRSDAQEGQGRRYQGRKQGR